MFSAARLAVDSVPWRMSQQREAVVLLVSVILKVWLGAIVVALMLILFGAIRDPAWLATSSVAWAVALLATRRIAQGPNRLALLRRARRRFLAQRRITQHVALREHCG